MCIQSTKIPAEESDNLQLIKTSAAKKATVEDDVDAPKIIEVINSMTFSAAMTSPNDPNSHAIKFTPSEKAANGKVKCEQFHFHMNTSEHTVDGKAYFAEVHMVCFKDRNANFTAAVDEGKPDSLAVFGFFLEESADGSADENVQTIIDLVKNNPDGSDNVSVKLPTAKNLSKYYRYMGGLTTPGCNEIVEWTVFADTVKVSKAQVDAINTWNAQLTENNRVTLPVHDREVTFYEVVQPEDIPSSKENTQLFIIVAVVAVVILVGIFVFMSKRSKKETPKNDAEGQPLK